MIVGDKIKELRLQMGVSRKRLSDLSGVAEGTIQQYENHKRHPQIEQLKKLANTFGVTLDSFFEQDDLEEAEELAEFTKSQAQKDGATTDDIAVLREHYLSGIIEEGYFRIYNDAQDAGDSAVLEAIRSLTENDLKTELLGHFEFLNKRGKFEAVLRLAELEDNYRFRREANDSDA